MSNGCDTELRCQLNWLLRCEGDKADNERQGSTTILVSADDKSDTFASASVCGESRWRISKVRWSCEYTAE